MEMLSYVVISWLWLDMAIKATQKIAEKDNTYSVDFYKSKIKTMQFYFKYELAKTTSLAETLTHKDVVTIKTEEEMLF